MKAVTGEEAGGWCKSDKNHVNIRKYNKKPWISLDTKTLKISYISLRIFVKATKIYAIEKTLAYKRPKTFQRHTKMPNR